MGRALHSASNDTTGVDRLGLIGPRGNSTLSLGVIVNVGLRHRACLLALACAVFACGDDDGKAPSSEGDGAAPPATPPPAAMDGGNAGTSSAGAPASRFDASVLPLPAFSGELCVLHVGASCDGPEDCASGQQCCAQFERATYNYTRIACSDRCADTDQYELCHPGQTCKASGYMCRRSLIVPHDFINVCASPTGVRVPEESSSVELEGEVVCGDGTCRAGEEVCCLRSRFDFATMKLRPLPPYCAPEGSACDCTDEVPIPDASVEDAG